jgi:hypothetical protein
MPGTRTASPPTGIPGKREGVADESKPFVPAGESLPELTLKAGAYTWEFVPVEGKSFRDSGTGTCSPRPAA